jgi:hypothetical protein
MRRGRKSAAQTPALKSERIYGSKKNPKGSASSEKSAKQITLSEKTMKALQNKLAEFKKSHTNKNITLNDLKAVYRRGSGAFSSSHRPNIPRNAWAMARVNKFLKKASGQKVKAAYVQDDDLMKYEDGGQVYYNSHGELSKWSEIRELEVDERENYTPEEFDEWEEKYQISPNDEVIWVTPERNKALTYASNFEDYDKIMSMTDNEIDKLIEEEGLIISKFDDNNGIIIPESDDGENGFLFVVKYEDGGTIKQKVYRGVGERVNETYGGRTDEGLGVFYTDNKTMAKWFAGLIEYDVDTERYESTGEKGNVEISTIELENPYIIDSTHEDYDIDNEHTSWNILMEKMDAKDKKEVESFVSKLVSEGYDGIVLKDNTTNYYEDGTYDIYVKFTPEQLGKFAKGGLTEGNIFKVKIYRGDSSYNKETDKNTSMWFCRVYKMNEDNVDGILSEDDDLEGSDIGSFSSREKAKDFLFKYSKELNVILLDNNGIGKKIFSSNNAIRFDDGGWVENKMELYHGGNLDEYNDIIAQKNGRYEYGAGLYLTTHQDTARKYAKGSRKLYKITIEKGVDIQDALIDADNINTFIKKYVISSKRKEISDRLSKWNVDGKIKAYIFNNVILNEKGISASNTKYLRTFLVDNGIDYETVDNPFGWGETMIVLYNMAKIIKVEKIDKSSYFDGGETPILLAPNGKPSNLTAEQYELVRTPQFIKFFGDWENNPESASKVVDENGEPLVVFHGTRNRFEIFDINKGGESNTLARVGFWFTPISSFAYNFADSSWWGKNNAFVYSVFLSIKNPKIYESSPEKDVVYSVVENGKIYRDGLTMTEAKKLANELNNEFWLLPQNKKEQWYEKYSVSSNYERYPDSYEKFKTDIYKIAGQTEEDANIGGLGMSLNNQKETLEKYRELLKSQNYDGILIRNTRFDRIEAGGLNDQYIALYPNQIKLANGINTTFDSNNPNMRFAKGGKTSKKKGIEARGDCYYIAGQFAMDNIFTPKKIEYIGTPYLVHGEVQGQGAVSHIRYGHAWIEDDENVYDFSNGRELVIPKVIYYAIGDINPDEPTKYKKYTFAEARRKMVDTGHYGCWDLDVEYKEGGEIYAESLKKYEVVGDIAFIRNSNYSNKGTLRKLLYKGTSAFAINRNDFEKIKEYAFEKEGVPKNSWTILDLSGRNIDVYAMKMSDTNDYVMGYTNKKPNKELFDKENHIIKLDKNDNIDYSNAYEILLVENYAEGGGIPSNLTNVRNSRLFIPDVRGGWTKEKIVKYFKNKLSDSISTFRLTKYISQFENWEQFKNHIYYHGTQGYIESGLKPSITMSEREAERSGGGGYGQRYYGISLTKRKRTAESFSGMSSGVTIYPVILKKDAKVIERTDLTDAADIEDIIVELYEQGIDAVWIGGGEEELVVVNPYSVLIYKDGKEYHRSYGGFKSIPLTDEKIKDIYETSKILWEEYSEEYKEKQNQEEKQSFLKSLPNIQFEKGGLIAPNGKKSNLNPEQYKLVRTPEFKAWFGDWENNPEEASKVVDKNGEPLVVWHYSKRLQYELDKFYVFNVDRQIGSHFGTIKQAQNLKYIPSGQSEVKTSNKELSDFRYYQVFLNIRNPIRLKDVGIFDEKTLIEAINDIEKLKDYDWEYINNYTRKSTDSLLDRVKHIAKGKEIDGAVYLNRYESDAESSYISSLDEFSDNFFKKKIPSAEDSWIAFYPEQIKLADGTNTSFLNQADIRYKKGGRIWNDEELLKRYKRGESIGFSGIAHLKSQGLIKRADGTKRKSMANGGEFDVVYRGELQPNTKNEIWVTGDEFYAKDYGQTKKYYIPKNLRILDTDLNYSTFEELVDEFGYGGDYDEYKFEPSKEFIKFLKEKGYDGFQHQTSGENILLFDKTKLKETAEDGAEVLTIAEKNLFDIYDIQTILKLQKTSFKNGGETENIKIILVPENYQKMKTDLVALKGIGNPRIAMLDDNHTIMGGVFINEDEYECNFDIRLKDEHRHKGYNCLLIKALIKDFHDNMDMEMLVCENDFTQKLGWENGCFTRANAKDFMRVNKHKYINYLHTDLPKIMDEFNASNQDENQDITCVGCGWKWNTSQSDKSDKYVCHQCGFDNTLFYDTNIMNRLKKPMSVPEISTKHNADEEYVLEQLQKGMKHEMEHTDDEQIAEIIALHHIGERPDYYEVLETMKLAKGGDVEIEQEIMEYDIPEYIQSEREFAKQVMNSDETRISRAMICKAKIDNALHNEMKVETPEEKNAWAEVNDIWKKCFYEIMSEDVHEHQEEHCGCGCQTTTYKKGGECGCDDTPTYNKGGLAYGNSHDKGGMPLKVASTGQDIEIEGGEGVINKRSMQMSKKLEFEGKEMTPCEVISKINEMGGGVKFKCADVKKIIAEDGNFD